LHQVSDARHKVIKLNFLGDQDRPSNFEGKPSGGQPFPLAQRRHLDNGAEYIRSATGP
jgi:hypothetical protein